MKKSIKATLSLAFAATLALSAACAANNGDGTNGNRPKGDKIVIYAGGSSEFKWIKGSAEDEIIDYIEQKYYDETGNSLDFEVAFQIGRAHV